MIVIDFHDCIMYKIIHTQHQTRVRWYVAKIKYVHWEIYSWKLKRSGTPEPTYTSKHKAQTKAKVSFSTTE